jgi:hypothetical protein
VIACTAAIICAGSRINIPSATTAQSFASTRTQPDAAIRAKSEKLPATPRPHKKVGVEIAIIMYLVTLGAPALRINQQ